MSPMACGPMGSFTQTGSPMPYDHLMSSRASRLCGLTFSTGILLALVTITDFLWRTTLTNNGSNRSTILPLEWRLRCRKVAKRDDSSSIGARGILASASQVRDRRTAVLDSLPRLTARGAALNRSRSSGPPHPRMARGKWMHAILR
uniref:Uncharacterized protein n=1 Tax=Trichuris muris TaxID=70415 RepID=A0A5S6QC65_TRIMR